MAFGAKGNTKNDEREVCREFELSALIKHAQVNFNAELSRGTWQDRKRIENPIWHI